MFVYIKRLGTCLLIVSVVFSLLIGLIKPTSVSAVVPPDRTFGITDTYSVYGHAGITNANAGTRVWGNVGDNNVGHAGFTAVQVPDGIIDVSTANGTAIENDASSVYDSLMSATQGTPAGVVTSLDLAGTHTVANGNPITPGVYNVGATTLNGDVELSGAGVYIFRSSASLTIATSGGTMILSNGATPCNVFWAVPVSMTIGTGSHIEGTIIAQTGLISLATGASLVGRAISLVSQVTLDNNQITEPTCTPVPATLHITKTVITDNGGTAVASDFTLNVTGTNVSTSSFAGSASGVDVTLDAGAYTVTEPIVPAGYSQTVSGNCSGTITAGETKECTIINDDISPHLIVKKVVTIDNGGTAVASDFTLNVTGTNVSTSSFAGSASGVDVTLDAGAYTVTEPIVPAGYSQTGSGNCSGTIALGETITCIITNNDIAPQLIVNKVVVNDNVGTKDVSDFHLFIDGGSVTSGVVSSTSMGLHTVSETSDSGYTSTIGGDCDPTDGTITLSLGDVKTCTITNDDIVPSTSGGGGFMPVPPLIDVVKVPSPLALPEGPGPVEYTYTLSNIGTVPVTNITMVGDTCSPIIRISGDTNGDSRLDVNEKWIYTCSTILSETHTNIITAVGWANGMNATDIANATVIVGIPVVPPLIHVTKVPNPLVLSAEGGIVTYTNKVTNPGTVALANVNLIDDKCGPVNYISGDINNNSKLDITETWTYTCQTELNKTTVNTVTASGEANGLVTRDFAIATVVVSSASTPVVEPIVTVVPKLPDTGLVPSDNSNTPWNIIVPTGIFAILTLLYFVRRKKTA